MSSKFFGAKVTTICLVAFDRTVVLGSMKFEEMFGWKSWWTDKE